MRVISLRPGVTADPGLRRADVLRVVLELDGDVIVRATPEDGYLHRGDEKIAENTTTRVG